MIGWLLEWLLQCLKIVSKSFEILSKIYQKIIKNLSKMVQKWFKNRSESVHRAVLEGSWAILAPRWPQDGPKSPQNLENRFLGPPLGGHFGNQNRSKSVSRAIRKVIVFMIGLKIDFWSDLVPTYRHLDPPNHPKMEPSWLPNRCKLEC